MVRGGGGLVAAPPHHQLRSDTQGEQTGSYSPNSSGGSGGVVAVGPMDLSSGGGCLAGLSGQPLTKGECVKNLVILIPFCTAFDSQVRQYKRRIKGECAKITVVFIFLML